MSAAMRVLSLYPEHVEALRLGLRTVETRSWRTGLRERIALHASLRDPDSAEARRDPISRRVMDALPHGRPIPRGVIAMTVRVVDCAPIGGPFDFVFSDADKDWYPNYFKAVFPKLAAGGCYATHNISERGRGRGTPGSREYLELLRRTPGADTTVDERGGGMAITCKRST